MSCQLARLKGPGKNGVFRCIAGRQKSDSVVEECSKEQLKEAVDQLEQCSFQVDLGTYASLVRQCGNAKALLEGKRVHALICPGRYDGDTFLGNLLVQMYGKCGSLEDANAVFGNIRERNTFSWNIMLAAYTQNGLLRDARILFDSMPEKDVVSWNAMVAGYAQHKQLRNARSMFDEMPSRNAISWNAMVSAYAQNGHCIEALGYFRKMDLEGVQADKVSFVTVLDACATGSALAEGKLIHDSILNSKWQSEVIVGNSLVNMYSKCGSLEEAKTMFDKMPLRDVTSWTAITTAYTQRGYLDDARVMFEKAPEWSVVSWNAMISAYGQNGKVEEAKCMFERMPEQNVVSGNTMIAAYAQNGNLQEARSLFQEMAQRDVVSWTAIMAAHTQNGYGKEALRLFRVMVQEGVQPNRVTYIAALDACANFGVLTQGRFIHAQIIENGSDAALANSLINMYGKCGSIEEARSIFNGMTSRGVVSWNSVIAAYAQNGNAVEALVLFATMHLEGIQPNAITFISILDACRSLVEGKLVHSLVSDSGYQPDTKVGTALVNFYGKFGCLEEAKMAFEQVLEQNVVLHTAMISAYAQSGHGKEALDFFKRMDSEGITPNEVTFVSVLDGCASVTAVEEGKLIHEDILEQGLEMEIMVANSLVNMYSKCGKLKSARKIFDRTLQRDVVSWNAMILGYAQNGYVKEALDLQLSMNLDGVNPNEVTFISIFSACSHAGSVDDSLLRFASISGDYGMAATAEHYLCLIGLLGRAGKLDEAEQLIESMPFEPDIVAWTALLGASRVVGDVKRGAYAAERVLKLDPDRNATYVLIWNICAESMHS